MTSNLKVTMDGASATRNENTSTTGAMRRHRALDRHLESQHASSNDAALTSEPVQSAAREACEVADSAPCWCVSKGMAGMNSQTSGLARAVGLDFEFRDAVVSFPWNCLPLQIVPRSSPIFRNASVLEGPPPALVISCGRHGILPALILKKNYRDRVFTVHIQDPKIDPANFDLVVVPRHDDTRGDNVYLTNGALHYVTPEKLAAASRSPEAAGLGDGDSLMVTVLLGGKNGYYSFAPRDVDLLVGNLRRIVREHDCRLVILKSRRTPDEVADRMTREFGEQHFVWDGKGTNPYFAGLALADYVIVTGDSVSMVTEATATGSPVFVQHLTETRPARRFRRFHEMFEAGGFTRPFAGQLAEWKYASPNDTPIVAQLIRERLELS